MKEGHNVHRFLKAANDNGIHAGPAPERRVDLDGSRVTALRRKVDFVTATYPFLASGEQITEAVHAVSAFTHQDVIRMINSFDPDMLDDTKTPMYAALLQRLDTGVIEE